MIQPRQPGEFPQMLTEVILYPIPGTCRAPDAEFTIDILIYDH
jgi:hypothetical protein